jgi:hypothetical protein
MMNGSEKWKMKSGELRIENGEWRIGTATLVAAKTKGHD